MAGRPGLRDWWMNGAMDGWSGGAFTREVGNRVQAEAGGGKRSHRALHASGGKPHAVQTLRDILAPPYSRSVWTAGSLLQLWDGKPRERNTQRHARRRSDRLENQTVSRPFPYQKK